MVAIELDAATERQLNTLARSQGADLSALARQIIEDYVAFMVLKQESPDDWAEASVALAAEFAAEESWSEARE